MFAWVSGSPRARRIASDQASWLAPRGVSYSAVGAGAPAAVTGGGAAAACVGAAAAGCDAAADGECTGAADVGTTAGSRNVRWVKLAWSSPAATCGPDAAFAAGWAAGLVPRSI